MASSRELILQSKTALDEMCVTVDEIKRFNWVAIEDEFGLKYMVCFENKYDQEIHHAALTVKIFSLKLIL